MKETTEYNIDQELHRARRKFPDPSGLFVALIEEVGELAKALNEAQYFQRDPFFVYEEAIHVASTVIRLIEEGDPSACLSYGFKHEYYQRFGTEVKEKEP